MSTASAGVVRFFLDDMSRARRAIAAHIDDGGGGCGGCHTQRTHTAHPCIVRILALEAMRAARVPRPRSAVE